MGSFISLIEKFYNDLLIKIKGQNSIVLVHGPWTRGIWQTSMLKANDQNPKFTFLWKHKVPTVHLKTRRPSVRSFKSDCSSWRESKSCCYQGFSKRCKSTALWASKNGEIVPPHVIYLGLSAKFGTNALPVNYTCILFRKLINLYGH